MKKAKQNQAIVRWQRIRSCGQGLDISNVIEKLSDIGNTSTISHHPAVGTGFVMLRKIHSNVRNILSYFIISSLNLSIQFDAFHDFWLWRRLFTIHLTLLRGLVQHNVETGLWAAWVIYIFKTFFRETWVGVKTYKVMATNWTPYISQNIISVYLWLALGRLTSFTQALLETLLLVLHIVTLYLMAFLTLGESLSLEVQVN